MKKGFTPRALVLCFAFVIAWSGLFSVSQKLAAKGPAPMIQVPAELKGLIEFPSSKAFSFSDPVQIHPWGNNEAELIIAAFKDAKELAPGLVRRATAYGTLRFYRTKSKMTSSSERIVDASASVSEDWLALNFRDGYFDSTLNDPTYVMLHELTHLADKGSRAELSADWIRLIDPLFARIDSRLKPYGFTCKEATNMPKSKIEHMRYAKTIALEEGLPGLYACTNRGEALAEYVASWALKPDFRGRLPSSFLAFLRKWCLDLPFEPIPAVAAFIEGRQHQQGRRADKAIAAYSRALTLDPTFTRAFMDRGNQWFQKKEYKKAIADFDQAEQLSKGTGVDIIYLFRGYALMQIGEYARALPDYDKYMLLWPRDVRVYLNRAKLFKLTKEYDKGIAELTNAIHSFPKHQIAYRARADLLVKTKRYDEALKDLTHLVEMRPKNAEYYVMRGAVHKLKGDFDKALADLDQGIQLKPKLEASYYERGEVFKHRKDYEQAITEYTRAIEVHPRFVRAYFERGKMYQHLNQHERAIADFEAALRLLPKMEATIGPWLERSKKHLVK